MNETSGGRPDMWLYFKSVPDEMLADPGDQLRQILAFRRKIEEERSFFYRTFDTTEAWEREFREQVRSENAGVKSSTPAGITRRVEMKVLYLAWRDPQSRNWFPVGRLSFDGGGYRFVYTRGAKQSLNFIPFARMEDLSAVYESNELFPLFANRLLSKKRPEYTDFLHWLNVRPGEDDPLTVLGRTEGIRETDSLAVFPCPERGADNTYRVQFFGHGLRYLLPEAMLRIHKLFPGEQLYLMPDPQNQYDSHAVALRANDPVTLVGYCPRYLAGDFLHLLKESGPGNTRVIVEKVNPDAPIQLRLLCRLTAEWPENFRPCSGEWYEPLA